MLCEDESYMPEQAISPKNQPKGNINVLVHKLFNEENTFTETEKG